MEEGWGAETLAGMAEASELATHRKRRAFSPVTVGQELLLYEHAPTRLTSQGFSGLEASIDQSIPPVHQARVTSFHGPRRSVRPILI
jgi:hypothetical protein